jgi:hypothetical protein
VTRNHASASARPRQGAAAIAAPVGASGGCSDALPKLYRPATIRFHLSVHSVRLTLEKSTT